jgi:hypothetical protein
MGSSNKPADDGQGADSGFGDTRRPFNFILVLRERHQIRRICSESLDLYRRIEAELPGASNLERYARVIAARSGAGPDVVQAAMRRAAENFATWPAERPLNFRDIVQYIAVTGGLKTDLALTAVRSQFVDSVFAIVAEMIPVNL